MIALRPAMPKDADDLFAWRNDPVTLACFRSTAAVKREDHDRWMQFNVLQGYPEHIVLIAEDHDGKLGVIRFDAQRSDTMIYEASITVAPVHRGKGLARNMLAEACGYMGEFTINAEIRTANAASRRTFERCGFEEVGSDHGFVRYRKEPVT